MTEIQETTQTANSDEKLSTAALAGAADERDVRPAEEKGATQVTGVSADNPPETTEPLLARDETSEFQRRWDAIQASFVDEPRHAVEQADNLVATAMKHLAEVFAGERQKLEGQWDRGDQVSTEDLRVALRRYRTFFGRLLSV
jgi:hypothetical protein